MAQLIGLKKVILGGLALGTPELAHLSTPAFAQVTPTPQTTAVNNSPDPAAITKLSKVVQQSVQLDMVRNPPLYHSIKDLVSSYNFVNENFPRGVPLTDRPHELARAETKAQRVLEEGTRAQQIVRNQGAVIEYGSNLENVMTSLAGPYAAPYYAGKWIRDVHDQKGTPQGFSQAEMAALQNPFIKCESDTGGVLDDFVQLWNENEDFRVIAERLYGPMFTAPLDASDDIVRKNWSYRLGDESSFDQVASFLEKSASCQELKDQLAGKKAAGAPSEEIQKLQKQYDKALAEVEEEILSLLEDQWSDTVSESAELEEANRIEDGQRIQQQQIRLQEAYNTFQGLAQLTGRLNPEMGVAISRMSDAMFRIADIAVSGVSPSGVVKLLASFGGLFDLFGGPTGPSQEVLLLTKISEQLEDLRLNLIEMQRLINVRFDRLEAQNEQILQILYKVSNSIDGMGVTLERMERKVDDLSIGVEIVKDNTINILDELRVGNYRTLVEPFYRDRYRAGKDEFTARYGSLAENDRKLQAVQIRASILDAGGRYCTLPLRADQATIDSDIFGLASYEGLSRAFVLDAIKDVLAKPLAGAGINLTPGPGMKAIPTNIPLWQDAALAFLHLRERGGEIFPQPLPDDFKELIDNGERIVQFQQSLVSEQAITYTLALLRQELSQINAEIDKRLENPQQYYPDLARDYPSGIGFTPTTFDFSNAPFGVTPRPPQYITQSLTSVPLATNEENEALRTKNWHEPLVTVGIQDDNSSATMLQSQLPQLPQPLLFPTPVLDRLQALAPISGFRVRTTWTPVVRDIRELVSTEHAEATTGHRPELTFGENISVYKYSGRIVQQFDVTAHVPLAAFAPRPTDSLDTLGPAWQVAFGSRLPIYALKSRDGNFQIIFKGGSSRISPKKLDLLEEGKTEKDESFFGLPVHDGQVEIPFVKISISEATDERGFPFGWTHLGIKYFTPRGQPPPSENEWVKAYRAKGNVDKGNTQGVLDFGYHDPHGLYPFALKILPVIYSEICKQVPLESQADIKRIVFERQIVPNQLNPDQSYVTKYVVRVQLLAPQEKEYMREYTGARSRGASIENAQQIANDAMTRKEDPDPMGPPRSKPPHNRPVEIGRHAIVPRGETIKLIELDSATLEKTFFDFAQLMDRGRKPNPPPEYFSYHYGCRIEFDLDTIPIEVRAELDELTYRAREDLGRAVTKEIAKEISGAGMKNSPLRQEILRLNNTVAMLRIMLLEGAREPLMQDSDFLNALLGSGPLIPSEDKLVRFYDLLSASQDNRFPISSVNEAFRKGLEDGLALLETIVNNKLDEARAQGRIGDRFTKTLLEKLQVAQRAAQN